MKRILITFIALLIVLSPYSFEISCAKVTRAEGNEVFGTITDSTTWDLLGIPYIISGDILTIESGATLTINPGVVVKLDRGEIRIKGNLIASGTAELPIVFTSIHDDNYGGNSDTDYNIPPEIGDWDNITVKDGGYAELNYTKIYYGGSGSSCYERLDDGILRPNMGYAAGCGIDNVFKIEGRAMINNSEIIHNGKGLIFDGTDLTISHTTISENTISLEIYGDSCWEGSYSDCVNNKSHLSVTDSKINNNLTGIQIYPGFYYNQDTGEESLFCGGPIINFVNNEIAGNTEAAVNSESLCDINFSSNWWGSNKGPYHELRNLAGDNGSIIIGDVSFWPWLTEEPKPEEPVETKLNPVIIVPGIMGSWNVSGKWELDPILHTYDNLWEALKTVGYIVNKSLFAFPYQWRLSNSYNALELKQKIQDVKNTCTQQADLNKIDCSKVDIVAHSMGGLVTRAYVESNDYQNDIDQLIFLATPHRGATKAYLMWEGGEFGQNSSDFVMERILNIEAEGNGYGSLSQYIRGLPLQSVRELLPIYNYLRDDNTNILRNYPNNYPANVFLEQLNRSTQLEKLNSVKITNIIAQAGDDSTINNLRVVADESFWGEWEHGYPEHYRMPFTDHGLEYSQGDITVPERSNIDFNGIDNKIINSNHSNIVTEAQKAVIKELTGQEPSEDVGLNIIQKIFMVRIFSPADFFVIAPDNKKIGKDFATSQNINEIPGAFYSGFADGPEFLTIPNPIDGEYKIYLQGTGNGEYKLSTSLIDNSSTIDNNKNIDQEYNGQIGANQTQEFKIDYQTDSDGNSVINEPEPVDNVPPVVIINKPIPRSKYLHSNNLIIDYAVTDDFSGVATTTITIDNKEVATTTINLFDYMLGEHILVVKAMDKSGNQAQTQINFEIIANTESTISDIKEIYNLGWLKDKIYQSLLINAFKSMGATVKIFDEAKESIEKIIVEIKQNQTLSEEQRQKLIEQYNIKLNYLQKARVGAINVGLSLIEKLLNAAKSQNKINQSGYDIIINNINYLKDNL